MVVGLFGFVMMSDFRGVFFGRRLAAVVMVHHCPGLHRQVLIGKAVLRLVVVDKGDDVGQFFAGKVKLFAESALLGGDHGGRVI